LINDAPQTNSFQVAMTWEQGPIFFGALVIDYTLSFDRGLGDDSLTVLASNIIPTSYILTDVVYGTTYTFRVQARSEYEDLSEYSAALSILAA
jgi:hypothetical protein